MSRHPEVQWAEREDKVYLTVMLADAKDVKVDIDPGVFTFSGSTGADNTCYELKLELRGKVDVEESKVNGNCCVGDGKSPHYVKVDRDKWIDEDDDKVPADVDTGGMGFSKFGAIGSGFGNFGSVSGSMDGGTEEEDVEKEEKKEKEKEKRNMSGYPDMSDFNNDGFDFAGFGEEAMGNSLLATHIVRLLRCLGGWDQRVKEFKTINLDPNNPEDMNKTIHF
ncbi:hypothetical protein OROMI_027005 [Orobanche minor]